MAYLCSFFIVCDALSVWGVALRCGGVALRCGGGGVCLYCAVGGGEGAEGAAEGAGEIGGRFEAAFGAGE